MGSGMIFLFCFIGLERPVSLLLVHQGDTRPDGLKNKKIHARETRSVRAASIVWARFGKEEEGVIAVALSTDDDAAKTCSDNTGHVIRNGPLVHITGYVLQ